jgi:preprotein translocase SecE subunit
MATKKSEPKKRRVRKSETVRQKAEIASKVKDTPKPRRVKKTLSTAGKPVSAAYRFGQKEYYLPMPKNKFGRFLNKRRYFIPKYFRESFKELKEVTWPDRKQTTQLTIAVFVFAITFGIMVAVVDYGLDRIFKRILIK